MNSAAEASVTRGEEETVTVPCSESSYPAEKQSSVLPHHSVPSERPDDIEEIRSEESGTAYQQETNGSSQGYLDMLKIEKLSRKRPREEQVLIEIIGEKEVEIKCKENEQVSKENKKLRRENAELLKENVRLESRNKSLHEKLRSDMEISTPPVEGSDGPVPFKEAFTR